MAKENDINKAWLEIGRRLNDDLQPITQTMFSLYARIREQYEPITNSLHELLTSPWVVSNIGYQAIEEGNYYFIDSFIRNWLMVKGWEVYPSRTESRTRATGAVEGHSKIMHAALQTWLSRPQWFRSETDNPIHYLRSIVYRQLQWHLLDVDHKDGGFVNYGSLYRRRVRSINSREPDQALSFDVMQEMDGRRAENEKEAFYEEDWEEYIVNSHDSRPVLLDHSGETVTNQKGNFVYIESTARSNTDLTNNDGIKTRNGWDDSGVNPLGDAPINSDPEPVQAFERIKERKFKKRKWKEAKRDEAYILSKLTFNGWHGPAADVVTLPGSMNGKYIPASRETLHPSSKGELPPIGNANIPANCFDYMEAAARKFNHDRDGGYYNNRWTLLDEHEKLIYCSCIPRLKRNGADPALSYCMEDDIIARVDTEAAIYKAGLGADDAAVALSWENTKSKDDSAEYLNGQDPDEWRRPLYTKSEHNKTLFPSLVSSLDRCVECGKFFNITDIRCRLILPDGSVGYKCSNMNPPRRLYIKVNNPPAMLSILTNLSLYNIKPEKKKTDKAQTWNKKQVAASKQRIKRAIKADKLTAVNICADDMPQVNIIGCCWECIDLIVNNTNKNDGGSYTRQYICRRGNEVNSLYSHAGDCFRQASKGEQNIKLKKLRG